MRWDACDLREGGRQTRSRSRCDWSWQAVRDNENASVKTYAFLGGANSAAGVCAQCGGNAVGCVATYVREVDVVRRGLGLVVIGLQAVRDNENASVKTYAFLTAATDDGGTVWAMR